MPVRNVIILAIMAICGIFVVFFHRQLIEILLNLKDSFKDFMASLKYGNFTERENSICNVYLNYHYPRYTPYKNYCWNCQKEVNSTDSPRCPVCGIYICLECGACHPNCSDRDEKIYISEKEVRAMLSGKKRKAIINRINTVKSHANDKIYYCAMAEKEFGAVDVPKRAKELDKNINNQKK
ncbi:MAG: hypothetical protein MJ147_06270 [Clostridia bacterium]|nr:hypothetical protein [Clostridia bacterium]